MSEANEYRLSPAIAENCLDGGRMGHAFGHDLPHLGQTSYELARKPVGFVAQASIFWT